MKNLVPFYREKRHTTQIVIPRECGIFSFCSPCWVLWLVNPAKCISYDRTKLGQTSIFKLAMLTVCCKHCDKKRNQLDRNKLPYLSVKSESTKKAKTTLYILRRTAFQNRNKSKAVSISHFLFEDLLGIMGHRCR